MCLLKSTLKTNLLAIACLSFCFSSSIGYCQSDDAPADADPIKKPAFANPFSKMFSKKEDATEDSSSAATKNPKAPSNSKPALSSARAGKPPINATPTSNRGGLLMPLKSFTNKVFRSGDNALESSTEAAEELEALSTKPTREPFRNLPRPRIGERRDERFTNDISVQTVEAPNPPADIPTFQGTTEKQAAPVFRNESAFGTNSNSKNSVPKPTTTLNPPAPIYPALGVNSTSRRTGDLAEEARPSTTNSLKSSSNAGATLLDLSNDSTSKSPANINSPSSSKPANRFSSESNKTTTSSSTVTPQTISPSFETSVLESPPKVSDSTGTPLVSSIRTRAEPKPKPETTAKAVSSKQEASPIKANSLSEMSQPSVRVYVNGPESLLVGQDAVYEVVAKNEGLNDLSGLLLRISVPATIALANITASEGTAQPDNENGEHAVGWEIEKLAAGASKNLRFSLQTQQPEHFAMGVEWTSLPNTSQLQINVQQPKLDLALEGPSEAEFGTPQNYRLRIKNPGNAVVKAVEIVLTAETFGSNQSVIGDIQPGSERIVDVELLFQQHGVIPIVATATSAVSKLQARNAIDVRVKHSAILAQWVGPTEFYQGSVAEYSLTLTNQGEAPALNIPCTVKLPLGADPTTLPPGATRRGNVIQWEMKRLMPLESITVPFHVLLGNVGNNTFSFSAETKNGAAPSTEFTTIVDSIADLKLTVIDPIAPAPIGQTVFYEIEISNRGRKAANSVEVIAQFSDGIEPIRFEGHSGRIVPGQAIFSPIPSIAPGEKVTLKLAAEAKSAGVHRFRAEVKSASSDTDLIHEESTRYLATGSSQTTRR